MIVADKEKMATAVYQPLAVDFKVYLVTDRKRMGGRPFFEAITDALKGGVKAIQLREKDLPTRDYLRLAYEMRALTLKFDSRLFINDRVDIAIAVDADGVHLGQESIPPFAVRKLSSRLIVGVSAHTMEEALRAESTGADFITLGPIYSTPSKRKYGKPLGLDTLRAIATQVRIPVFAIGGVKLENLGELMDTGASGVSLISGVFEEKIVRTAAGKIIRTLG